MKKIPDENECEALWDEVALPAHIRRHCEAVMRRACALCEELQDRWSFDEDLVSAGAMLHDILRLQPCHARAGAEFLRQRGYDERLARIVEGHMCLTEDMRENLDERAVVFLADKLVSEDEPCTIAARYMAAALRGADPGEMEKQTQRTEELYRALQNGKSL